MFEILIQNGFEIFQVKYRVNAIKIIWMDYSYSVDKWVVIVIELSNFLNLSLITSVLYDHSIYVIIFNLSLALKGNNFIKLRH